MALPCLSLASHQFYVWGYLPLVLFLRLNSCEHFIAFISDEKYGSRGLNFTSLEGINHMEIKSWEHIGHLDTRYRSRDREKPRVTCRSQA
jgi:hypothetical protein